MQRPTIIDLNASVDSSREGLENMTLLQECVGEFADTIKEDGEN